MGEITGFKKYGRDNFKQQTVSKRIKHWGEFTLKNTGEKLNRQAARCMDCGVPFCHFGCPVNNIIPEWNDLVYKGHWKIALEKLLKTNNFPEFTGRICPAPCENSCTLSINDAPVTIKNIELSIIEKGYDEGWIKPQIPPIRSGEKVAIIGSGPAGLTAADQLNKRGHLVTVFEKDQIVGGLLTLGIPEFKLEKSIVDRKVNLMKEEGIVFKVNSFVGEDINIIRLKENFDAIVLAGGAKKARDLPIEGRNLGNIHFAVEFLSKQNLILKGLKAEAEKTISAKGKNVIVLGGGDTGSDCVGTAIRQGAKSVRVFELLAKPPKKRTVNNPWPQWAFIERSSTSFEEGCERRFGILTKKFTGENGVVKKLHAVQVEFSKPNVDTERMKMNEIMGTESEMDVDLVLLALGFLVPSDAKLLSDMGIERDTRGNVKTNAHHMTNAEGIFAAGDMRRGQSLIVWAINEGRETAKFVDQYLTKKRKTS